MVLESTRHRAHASARRGAVICFAGRTALDPNVADEALLAKALTPCDLEYLVTYLGLLEDDADDAD